MKSLSNIVLETGSKPDNRQFALLDIDKKTCKYMPVSETVGFVMKNTLNRISDNKEIDGRNIYAMDFGDSIPCKEKYIIVRTA